ncbi:MAG TPA: histidine phosphatase family protein [Desulfobulbaceae bacterium]|nr:histidine phosphatase family protein [Desulfobulbaceae bacterium]
MTRFGLIRHAHSLWNGEKRVQGQKNSPLSEPGREMATAWGKQLRGLPWNRILISDLGRVKETGKLINESLHLPMHTDSRLREQDWGEWSGLEFAELLDRRQDVFSRQQQRGWHFRPPRGESRLDVLARSQAALRDASRNWPGEKVLVISHEGVLKCLVYHLCGRKFLPSEQALIEGYNLHLLQICEKTLLLEKLRILDLLTLKGAEPEPLF